MKRLLMGLLIASGLMVAQASAGCIGCLQQGMACGPVPCDYSHLWNGFSPTSWNYTPDCWSGGCCGKGIVGDHVVGLLDRVRAHCQRGGCGIACNSVDPNIGWGSIGHGVDDPGVDGYGGSGLTTFHGLSGAGPRLMGNPRCCTSGNCFAGPCDTNCGNTCSAGGLACHSFQTGWLSCLMERLRSHCSAQCYACGSLDPCGTLRCRNSYPAGNLNLNFGACSDGCGGSCGYGGGCDGQMDGGGAYPVESYDVDHGTPAAPTPTDHPAEPQPAGNNYSHPAAAFDTESELPSSREVEIKKSAPVEYPRTDAVPLHHGAQPTHYQSPSETTTPTGFGDSQGQLDFVSWKR